ncbi:hypothetical protein JMF97_29500 [Micromonospora fiedleri]|uniref:Uncharacterized protein n=1 Tax=Micromonospora fiedleri TaxID=1157498 RepID=A0ABS1UVE0_9ACTN|nr:hypothetical protein [Micromonospora fiedleri]MBL6280303.1 hypothetical protein [Micromonospora fiedleri]
MILAVRSGRGSEDAVSWVANVMLSVGLEDRLNAEAFSDWLDSRCRCREPGMGPGGCGRLRFITGVDNQWGGHKNPEGALRQYAPSSPDEEDDEFWPPVGS